MGFLNPELFNQLLEPRPIVTTPLAALVQVFHEQLHRYQAGEIAIDSIVVAVASELSYLETWIKKTLTKQDEVVLETPALAAQVQV